MPGKLAFQFKIKRKVVIKETQVLLPRGFGEKLEPSRCHDPDELTNLNILIVESKEYRNEKCT